MRGHAVDGDEQIERPHVRGGGQRRGGRERRQTFVMLGGRCVQLQRIPVDRGFIEKRMQERE